ncbi:MAG: hypothetical protein IKP31_00100 [Lachnospiraceae bacterium]|nr:hypothetical protein [Lachnospiraceae bacterium]
MRSVFAFAGPKDSLGILKIMEADITPGGLQLLYTRRDDPYVSFLKESPDAKVGVIKEDGHIVATLAAIPRRMYIGGVPRKVCYVTNMKRLKEHDMYINWHEMFREMCMALDCDLYFCSLLGDNDKVQRMLHKKRRYMPYARVLCGYRTYILSPQTGIKTSDIIRRIFGRSKEREAGLLCDEYELTRGLPGDEADIVRFLNTCGKRKDLFPVFDRLSDLGEICSEDFCLLKKAGNIVAAGALWDRNRVKQYVVKSSHGIYALFRFLNPVLPYLGYIQIPKDDEMARFAFVSFLLAENDCEEYIRKLLSYICSEARDRYPMLVIGTDTGNEKYAVLNSLKSVSFDTQLNEVIMTNIDGKTSPVLGMNHMEAECAFL